MKRSENLRDIHRNDTVVEMAVSHLNHDLCYRKQ